MVKRHLRERYARGSVITNASEDKRDEADYLCREVIGAGIRQYREQSHIGRPSQTTARTESTFQHTKASSNKLHRPGYLPNAQLRRNHDDKMPTPRMSLGGMN
jgi:hypothetical protein